MLRLRLPVSSCAILILLLLIILVIVTDIVISIIKYSIRACILSVNLNKFLNKLYLK